MEKKPFDFWQNHSIHYLEMAFRTDKQERIEKPDGYGKRKGICGDTIEMFVSLYDGRVQSVSFVADGCMNTNACSNTVVSLAEGKTIEEAWKITTENVVNYLETLPSKETHCAELALGAFYLALSSAQKIKQGP
ncbi:MAG: iron-sulfur cluster assembly scaffold protein [Deltaproteobacteria bacterium]|nr:iron-sulfur cluster assembly scaffold protein [Deltaproteobacteria bacterium]